MPKSYVGEHIGHPGTLRAWLAFTRPQTWWIAMMPVIATLALAYSERHVFDPLVAFFTLMIAVLMQAITNMQNDLGYTERKAETGNRKGLPRATALGWISLDTARIAIRIAIGLALFNSLVLVWFGGWIFAVIGIASVVAAYSYMGGPKPIAYTPFGELVVLVFFGLTAVCGTYYLQTGTWSMKMILLGIALGCIASSVLCVNNFRDREHDESVGRRTLAVVLGEERFKRVFTMLIMLPYGLVAAMVLADMPYWPYFLVMLSFPDCMHLPERMLKLKGEALNEVMFACVRLEVKFSLLFAVGALVQALLVDLTVNSLNALS